MKRSLAITALIVAIFAALGWRQQTSLSQLRDEQVALRSEAVALGIPVDAQPDKTTTPSLRASRPHPERAPADVKAVAGEVTLLLADIKAGKLDQSGKSGVERISEIVEQLYQLDAGQVRALLDEFRNSPELDDEGRRNVIGFAILTLADTHPEAAILVFSESPDLLTTKDGGGRREVLQKLLGSWAAKDPLAALDWMRENESKDPDLLDPRTTRGLIAGAAQKDPALAFELAMDLDGNDRTLAAVEIVKTAGTPEAQREMFSMLRKLSDAAGADRARFMEQTYTPAFAALAKRMAEQGCEATRKWLDDADPSPAECEVLATTLGSNKPPADSGNWLEWMGRKLPPANRDLTISPRRTRGTTGDYRAAGSWLAATPDSAVKRAAVADYAKTVAHYDPATAAQWAETLPAGGNREALLQRIHEEWNRRDPAAAASFADKHGIRR